MAEGISQTVSEQGIPTRDTHRDLDEARRALEGWFAERLPDRDDFRLTGVELPNTSGVANETLLCDASWNEDGQSRSGGFVVRVHSPDFLYKDVDLRVHADMYRALRDEPGIPVPAVIDYESDASVLGQTFFVMERLHGQVPADTPPFHTTGWVRDLPPEDRRALWRNGVEVMARLHQVPVHRFPFLQRPQLGPDGLRQDMAYWFDYGEWAARGRRHQVIDPAARWLRDNAPDRTVTELSWGDSRLPNMMFRDLQVVSVFDWDMVSLAGAESDLAWWTIMDFANTEAGGVERLPGIGSPVETIRLWQELTGREVHDIWFHLVYASYRMSVILVRLGDLFAEGKMMPKEVTDEFVTNNLGIQFLAQQLDIPHDRAIDMHWPGLEV